MVVLNIKRGDDPQFLMETLTTASVDQVLADAAHIYNERLRIERLCTEMEMLAEHGISKPPDMQGLTDEQVEELRLKDETSTYYPSGGSRSNPDDIGRRTGMAPIEKLAEVIRRTISEAKAIISKDQVKANVCMTKDMLKEAFDKLKGACMIVYPMGLPKYDPVQAILDNEEDLAGTQAAKDVIPEDKFQLWWAGKEIQRGKKLGDFIGKNEKTKIICKIQKKGAGAPVREPVVDEQTQKEMMAFAYKKQEEWKKLEEADDDSHHNAEWADSSALKSKMHGLGNIRFF